MWGARCVGLVIRTCVVGLLVVQFFGCQKTRATLLHEDRARAEYQVYSRMLADPELGGPSPRNGERRFIVVAETVGPEARSVPEFDLGKLVPEAKIATLEDFRRASQHAKPLTGQFDASLDVELVAPAEIARLFQGIGAWSLFYGLYPGAIGVFRLSAVGFDPELSEALGYFEHQWGGLGGRGRFVLLRRGKSGWTIVARHFVWES